MNAVTATGTSGGLPPPHQSPRQLAWAAYPIAHYRLYSSMEHDAHTLTRSTLIQHTHVLNLNCIRVVCCVFHLIQVCELQCFLFHENRTCNLPSHTFHMKTQVFSASFNLTQVCSSHKCGVCFFPLQCARLTVV